MGVWVWVSVGVSVGVISISAGSFQEPVPRILALSENCLVERDKATYSVVTLHPLNDVFALIRYPDDPQNFGIEYVSGAYRRYTCTDRWAADSPRLPWRCCRMCVLFTVCLLSVCVRDALLCSILDGVRASGNRDVCVKMRRTNLGLRLGPLYHQVRDGREAGRGERRGGSTCWLSYPSMRQMAHIGVLEVLEL